MVRSKREMRMDGDRPRNEVLADLRDELAEMADRLVTAIAEVVTTRGEGG